MRSRWGVLVCLAVLAVLLALPAAASATVTLSRLERQVVSLVNQKRAARGLVKLRVNDKLTVSARAHSAEMGSKQYFSHDSASGEDFARRVVRYGYARTGCAYWATGENIAWGSGLYATAVATVNNWMGSPAHRAVVLNAKYRDIGVGAVVSRSGYGQVSNPVTFFTLDAGRRVR